MDVLHALIVMDQSQILLIASLVILDSMDTLLESSAVGICSEKYLYTISCLLYMYHQYFLVSIHLVLHKPCQPQILHHLIYVRNYYVSFSWTGCSRDKVAPALEYLVSCADHIQIQRSTSKTVHGLRPNKQYSCSVYGIDSLGRLGEDASFRFRTNEIGKLYYSSYAIKFIMKLNDQKPLCLAKSR